VNSFVEGGRIEVITGSMFSGKTDELIKRVERAKIANKSVAAFSPAVDDRYGETTIGSHRGGSIEAVNIDPGSAAKKLLETDAEVVAIDEANFFNQDIVEACQKLADSGRRVIVAGIETTFRGEPFEPVPELMAVAEFVDKQRAVCAECGKPATRNQRLIDGEPAPASSPTVLVGGEDTYEARCRRCHTVPE
jgi:thymidine kinase